MALAGCGGAFAQWDLSTTASANVTWADNVDYVNAAAGNPNGDALANVRLVGAGDYTGSRWRFNGAYEPTGSFYRDRKDLDHLSHLGRVRSAWDLSRRTTLNVNDQFTYSPDQGSRSESINSPVVITSYTDRRSNLLNVNLAVALDALNTLTLGASEGFQTFSDPNLTDTSRRGAQVVWMRSLGAKSSFELNGESWLNRFQRRQAVSDNDPNTVDPLRSRRDRSQSYNATVGGTLGMGNYMSARGRAGMDLVVPDRAELSTSRSFHADGSVQWQSRSLTALLGYSQGLTTGSGLYAVSRTRAYYSSINAALGSHLNGQIFLNKSYSKSASFGGDEPISTFSGGASLDAIFTRFLTGRVQVSSNTQSSRLNGNENIDFVRVSVGIVARID